MRQVVCESKMLLLVRTNVPGEIESLQRKYPTTIVYYRALQALIKHDQFPKWSPYDEYITLLAQRIICYCTDEFGQIYQAPRVS